MRAGVVIQKLMHVTHRLESRRKFLVFLAENTVRRQPLVKIEVLHRFRKVGPNAAEQHRRSVLVHVMEKMFELFERNHIGVSSALQAQNNETDVLVFRAARKLLKTTAQLRAGAKKEFSLQIIKQHGGAGRVVVQTFAHHALVAYDQFGPAEQGSARNKQQKR